MPMTADEIIDAVKRITYKSDWHFQAHHDQLRSFAVIVRIIHPEIEPETLRPVMIQTIVRLRTDYYSVEDLLHDMYNHILDAEKHELLEWLKYDGKHYHNPHSVAVRLNDKGKVNIFFDDAVDDGRHGPAY